MNSEEQVTVLRGMLREVLKLRFAGGAYAKMAQAQGKADGYMVALLDAGLISRDAMLRIVGEERAKFSGEASAPVLAEASFAA